MTQCEHIFQTEFVWDTGCVFESDFAEASCVFNVQYDSYQIGGIVLPDDIEVYEGNYTVTPNIEGQILETASKYMEKNVQVKSIPYFETTNASGGDTVYIGKDVV